MSWIEMPPEESGFYYYQKLYDVMTGDLRLRVMEITATDRPVSTMRTRWLRIPTPQEILDVESGKIKEIEKLRDLLRRVRTALNVVRHDHNGNASLRRTACDLCMAYDEIEIVLKEHPE